MKSWNLLPSAPGPRTLKSEPAKTKGQATRRLDHSQNTCRCSRTHANTSLRQAHAGSLSLSHPHTHATQTQNIQNTQTHTPGQGAHTHRPTHTTTQKPGATPLKEAFEAFCARVVPRIWHRGRMEIMDSRCSRGGGSFCTRTCAGVCVLFGHPLSHCLYACLYHSAYTWTCMCVVYVSVHTQALIRTEGERERESERERVCVCERERERERERRTST